MPMDWGLARDYAARDVQTEEMHVTEEWNTCTDPIVMIEFLRGNPTCNDTVTWWNSDWRFEGAAKGDDRKFRLFSCACCRRIWDRIPEQCNRDAVVAVEDFLEGYVSAQELQEALCASSRVEWKEDGTKQSDPGYWASKYLGSGFYKMTAAASALLVASQVMFMADEEYGREASLDARFMSPMIYGRIGIHTPFQTSPNYSRTTPARSSKTLASIIAQLCVTSSATPSVPPRRSTPPGSRV